MPGTIVVEAAPPRLRRIVKSVAWRLDLTIWPEQSAAFALMCQEAT
jgi:hypothetical protein